MRSFIKYPGGKNHVYPEIKKILPVDFISYHEPFVGSGSIFLNLSNDLQLIGKSCYISDINTQLINTWRIIKENPGLLIKDIESFSAKFNDEGFYYALREMDRLPEFNTSEISDLRKASRFIILNKLGFNGLVRNSKKGFNNVAWGKKQDNFGFLPNKLLLEISNFLELTMVTNATFREILEPSNYEAKELIYLDPPYIPSQKNGSSNWEHSDHVTLKNYLDILSKNGVYWILSGHDKPHYRDLFKNYQMKEIPVAKRIAAKSENRKNVNELLIWSY